MGDPYAEAEALLARYAGSGRGASSGFDTSSYTRRAKARKNLSRLLAEQFPGVPEKEALAQFRAGGGPQEKFSVAGAAARSALANAIPTAAAIASGAGAARFARGLGPIPAAVVGIGGGIAGAYAANAGQQSLLDKFAPGVKESLSQAKEQHPWAYAAGELLPQLAVATPSASGLKSAFTGARALAQFRKPTQDQASSLLTAGLGAGLSFVSGLGSSKMAGQEVDWPALGLQTLAGAALTDPTKLGRKMGLPASHSGEPDPTEVAEAIASLKSRPTTLPSFEENVRIIKAAQKNLAERAARLGPQGTVQMPVDASTVQTPREAATVQLPAAATNIMPLAEMPTIDTPMPAWMGQAVSPRGVPAAPPRNRPSGGGAGRRGAGPMRPPEQESFLASISKKFANGVGRAANYIKAGMPSRTASGWDEGRAGIETGLSAEQAAASAHAVDDGLKTRPMPEFERQYIMKHGKPPGFDPRGVPTAPAPGEAKVRDVGWHWKNWLPWWTMDQNIGSGTKEGWSIVDQVGRSETDKRALGHALLLGDEAGNAHNELTKNYGVAPTTWSLRRIMGIVRPTERKYLFAALENKPVDYFKAPAEQAEYASLMQSAHDGSNPSFQAGALKTRELLDNVADILHLEPGQRLKDYFPHIFDRATLVADLKAKRAAMKGGGDAAYEKYLDDMIGKLQEDKARYVPDDILRDVPDEALFNNVKHRLANLDSYVKDPIKALEVYIKGATRKAAYDAYAPQLKEMFKKIRDNKVTSADGKPVRVDRAYQGAVQTYLDNFSGRSNSHQLADSSVKMLFPEFDRIHDPEEMAGFTRFFKTLNHHLLLGMNPGYAIRNMAVGRINSYAYIGLQDGMAAEKMLAQHISKKVATGKGTPMIDKLLRAKGLEADIPHEDWNLVKQIKGGGDINKYLSAASHWSELNIRTHAALAGALKAERQFKWGIKNSRLVMDEAAGAKAAETMQKAGLTFGDGLRPAEQQLGDLRTALRSYLDGKQDVNIKESYMFDQGYLAARETQHSYGTAAPTWLRAKHTNVADMATLYQSWFTKQMNFFWNKLDRKSKGKFLAYTAAVGGGSGVPLIQWAYEASPTMRSWINQAVQGEHDDETEVPWKTFLTQGLSGVVGLPSMASALGIGGLPEAFQNMLGVGRDQSDKGASFIGQAIGGPVLGGAAQAAYDAGSAALSAPEGLGGEAAKQKLSEANLPIRAPFDPAAGLKQVLGAEDKRPKVGRDGLANTATRLLLGSSQEEQWAKTYVPAAYQEKDRLRAEEDLTVDAAVRKYGPEGFEQIMQEVQAKMPNRVSADRIQNRILQETTPKQYWGLWTLKPEGSEYERKNLKLALKQIGRDKSGAPWAADLKRKLEADILQSQYEEEKSKPSRDDALLHALRLQLSMEYGRKVGEADAMTKSNQKKLQEYRRYRAGLHVQTTRRQLEAYQRLAGMQSQ